MGDFLTGIWENRMLMAAISGWLVAQILKTLLVLLLEKELRWERLFGSGGMPSSHSATVCALAAAAAVLYGSASPAFAISAIIAFIVMYDACNVRLEAVAIKELQQFFQDMGKQPLSEKKLKELVGHTLPQVLAGAILGILIGIVVAVV